MTNPRGVGGRGRVGSAAAAFVAVGMAVAGCSSGSDGSAGASSEASTPAGTPVSASATYSGPTASAHTPSAPSATVGVPTMRRINAVMTRTVEVKNPSVHFVPGSAVVSVPDGDGGRLSAVVGRRSGAADNGGEIVFFFHGTKFVGWDGDTETSGIDSLSGAGYQFKVRYAHYGPNDPACCPSLKPVTLRWGFQDNEGFVPSRGTRPRQQGTPVRVKLTD